MTSRNPRSIKAEIQAAYGDTLQYEVRGIYLKITCTEAIQRASILECTNLGDPAVKTSIQRSESRRNKAADSLEINFIAITGVPLDISEEEIQSATRADSVRRITKRDTANPARKVSTMAVALGYFDEAPLVGNKIHIDWFRLTIKQQRPQVIRCYKC